MDRTVPKFTKISSRADFWDADKWGTALKDTATGAAGGAVVGGPWGALIGGGAGLASNVGSDLAFRFYGNAKKLAWLAGDLQDKLGMIAGATDNEEVKTTAPIIAAGFKQFVDHYIRDGKTDSLGQDNIFTNKKGVEAVAALDSQKLDEAMNGGTPVDATGTAQSTESAPAEFAPTDPASTNQISPTSTPIAGPQAAPQTVPYGTYGWDEAVGGPGQLGNVYGLNPYNTNVDEYQTSMLSKTDPHYKWISEGIPAYMNNIEKIMQQHPGLTQEQALIEHMKSKQQSEQFAQLVMNQLKGQSVAASDIKFTKRVVMAAVNNELGWVDVAELLDDYGMYKLADEADKRFVEAADYGVNRNVGLGLSAYPALQIQPVTGMPPQGYGGFKNQWKNIKGLPQHAKGLGVKQFGKELFTKGNIFKGLLGAGLSIGANFAWDKLTQLDKNHVVKKSLTDAQDIVKDMRGFTSGLNKTQIDALNYSLTNVDKYLSTIQTKLYNSTTGLPWQNSPVAAGTQAVAPTPAPSPPWQQ